MDFIHFLVVLGKSPNRTELPNPVYVTDQYSGYHVTPTLKKTNSVQFEIVCYCNVVHRDQTMCEGLTFEQVPRIKKMRADFLYLVFGANYV